MNTVSVASPGNVAAPTAEGQGTTANVVGRSLRGIWWFGLGAVAVGGALAGQLIRTFVERGKEVEPRLAAPLKKVESVGEVFSGAGTRLKGVSSSLGESAQKIESVLEERFTSLLSCAQEPLRQEVQQLTKKVEELTNKIAQYESKSAETGTPKSEVPAPGSEVPAPGVEAKPNTVI